MIDKRKNVLTTGGLKFSLFGLRLSNTMMRATHLHMPNLSRLKLNSHFRPGERTLQAKPVEPRQTLPHSNTGHSLVIPALPIIPTISGHSHQCPNTKHQVPTGLPTSAFVFGLWSLRSCACPVLAAPVGQSSHQPLLYHILQLPREFEPRVHGHGVGIRGSTAQRASPTHPMA